jgi:hypothetical protein
MIEHFATVAILHGRICLISRPFIGSPQLKSTASTTGGSGRWLAGIRYDFCVMAAACISAARARAIAPVLGGAGAP